MKKLIITIILMMSVGFLYSQKWEAPAKYKTMKSTVNLKDQTVINNGKDLWAKNCKSCHGSKGLGDGPKSAMLKTNADLSKMVKSQTEGELYYKTFIQGNGEMPTYGKKITDPTDQWSLVAFMKNL